MSCVIDLVPKNRYSPEQFGKDQNAAHPIKTDPDPGSPHGDPVKFVQRQKVLLDDRMRTIPRSVCAGILQKQNARNPIALDAVTTEELQLTCGNAQSRDQYWSQSIDRTHTALGHTFLLNRLTHLSTDLTELANRKEAIAILQKDPSLLDLVQSALSQMKECEGPLLSFWNKVQVPNCVAKLGYQNLPARVQNYANKSALLREFCAQYETITSWLKLATQTASGAALALYGASQTGMIGNWPQTALFAERYSGSSNILAPTLYSLPNAVQPVALGAVGAAVLSTVPGSFRWHLADREIAQLFQTKMERVAAYFDCARKIYEALISTELLSKLEHFAWLEEFFCDPELTPFLESLQKLGSQQSALNHYLWHPMLISIQYMQDKSLRKKMEKALIALAEIDTVCSCAELVARCTAKTPYCLAEYSPQMSIDAANLFNPQIKMPVLNSLQEQKLVITGPNGGGKSTLLRASLLAAIMAQTLGIAPAARFQSPLFDDICSDLHIKENPQEGLSHFVAQVRRATRLLQDAQSNPNKRYLIGMDEPFNGTQAQAADQFSSGLLRGCGELQNALCIISTHDQLAEDALGKWTVTNMEYDTQTDTPLFRLTPGMFKNIGLAHRIAERAGCAPAILGTHPK